MRLFISCVLVAATLSADGGPAASAFPNDARTIAHVLSRIGYGPRPGDVDRVRALGLQKYIDQQLHPDRISDASMAARLSGLRTLTMSSREIAETFELPQIEARKERKQGEVDGQPKMPDPMQQRANS